MILISLKLFVEHPPPSFEPYPMWHYWPPSWATTPPPVSNSWICPWSFRFSTEWHSIWAPPSGNIWWDNWYSTSHSGHSDAAGQPDNRSDPRDASPPNCPWCILVAHLQRIRTFHCGACDHKIKAQLFPWLSWELTFKDSCASMTMHCSQVNDARQLVTRHLWASQKQEHHAVWMCTETGHPTHTNYENYTCYVPISTSGLKQMFPYYTGNVGSAPGPFWARFSSTIFHMPITACNYSHCSNNRGFSTCCFTGSISKTLSCIQARFTDAVAVW